MEAALAAAPALAKLFPGLTALQGLLGVALAWAWYHRVASRPVGAPPRPLREFRFNDHLIWGAIFTLGAMLLPLEEPWNRVIVNLLVVWMGIYAMRGWPSRER